MSVFTVDLFQGTVGARDTLGSLDALSQAGSNSVQRTIFITGPTGRSIRLKDGDTLNGCNYFKRFTYPTMALKDAILTLTTDDGSVYDDATGPQNALITTTLTAPGNSTYTDTTNVLDIYSTYGGNAEWMTISPTATVNCKMNGSTNSIFSIAGNATQTFNIGDLLISSVAFQRTTSGSSVITLQFGVKAVC